MKEEIVNERQCETEDEKIDIQQLLFKYILKSATIIQYTIKGRFMSR